MDRNNRFFYYSLGLHAVVLTILVVSLSWSSLIPVAKQGDEEREVINATVVSLPISSPKIPHPSIPIPRPPVAKPVEPPKPDAIPIADKKPKLIKIKKDVIEKQLLSDLAKQKKPIKKIDSKSIEASLEKDMSEMKTLTLQKNKQQEKNRLNNAEREQHARGEVDKYKALILQMISQNWMIPPSIDKTLFAELLIRVAPGGMVLDVQIIKSSGNEALDRSARDAVFKSSPLPVPSDVDAFAPFKQFTLKAKPQNVLSGDAWLS